MPAISTRSSPVSSVISGIAKRFKLMRSGASSTAARASALIVNLLVYHRDRLGGAVQVVACRTVFRNHLGKECGIASGTAELPEHHLCIDVAPRFGKNLRSRHLRLAFDERQMLEVVLAARTDHLAAMITLEDAPPANIGLHQVVVPMKIVRMVMMLMLRRDASGGVAGAFRARPPIIADTCTALLGFFRINGAVRIEDDAVDIAR